MWLSSCHSSIAERDTTTNVNRKSIFFSSTCLNFLSYVAGDSSQDLSLLGFGLSSSSGGNKEALQASVFAHVLQLRVKFVYKKVQNFSQNSPETFRNAATSPSAGHSEPAHPPVHHQGWMIRDQETVFCWVPVP
jgi:hypothetical protein